MGYVALEYAKGDNLYSYISGRRSLGAWMEDTWLEHVKVCLPNYKATTCSLHLLLALCLTLLQAF